jgi:hypothetical protein
MGPTSGFQHAGTNTAELHSEDANPAANEKSRESFQWTFADLTPQSVNEQDCLTTSFPALRLIIEHDESVAILQSHLSNLRFKIIFG